MLTIFKDRSRSTVFVLKPEARSKKHGSEESRFTLSKFREIYLEKEVASCTQQTYRSTRKEPHEKK